MSKELTGIVAEHIRAVNAFDTNAILATFAEDAYVNDNRREIAGSHAIKRWVEKELVGDRVTMEVREVVDHYGDTIVRAAYTCGKSKLPPELILSNYFRVRDGKIVSLAVIFNRRSRTEQVHSPRYPSTCSELLWGFKYDGLSVFVPTSRVQGQESPDHGRNQGHRRLHRAALSDERRLGCNHCANCARTDALFCL